MVAQTPVRRFTLDNGLTVVHQRNPISRTFCIGVWTRTGARDERRGEEGLCHFLEHMLFKGTLRRSAYEISLEIERVGGSLDAFTTKDTMCVQAHVLDSHRDLAIDLIGDMLTGSTFADELVEVERSVILEEIGDAEDAPDDLVHELFAAAVFPNHPLGRPILGTRESIARFSRDDLRRFMRRVFRGSNLVVSVYGNISEKELRRKCEQQFSLPAGNVRRSGVRLRRGDPLRKTVRRQLHQQHVCIGSRTFSYHEERRFPLTVLTTLLGGSMSSRLFQRIREEMGLTYNVFTYSDHSRDAGLMATYVAVKPSNTRRAIDAVFDEYESVRAGGVSKDELRDVKAHIKGRILLGLETSTARMMRMARNEISYSRQVSEKELLQRINSVTLDDVLEVASSALDSERQSVISLGPRTVGPRL